MSLFAAGLLTGLFITTVCLSLSGSSRRSLVVAANGYAGNGIGAAPGRVDVALLASICIALAAHATAGALGFNSITGVSVGTESGRSGDPAVASGSTGTRRDLANVDVDIARMEQYLVSLGRITSAQEHPAPQSQAGGLADVETMIASLAKRLVAEPGDVEGWRTLGWAYLNTSRPTEALKAYAKALELAPDRLDIKEAVDAARVAADGQTRPPAGGSTADANSSR